jgi:hypothetical protein
MNLRACSLNREHAHAYEFIPHSADSADSFSDSSDSSCASSDYDDARKFDVEPKDEIDQFQKLRPIKKRKLCHVDNSVRVMAQVSAEYADGVYSHRLRIEVRTGLSRRTNHVILSSNVH